MLGSSLLLWSSFPVPSHAHQGEHFRRPAQKVTGKFQLRCNSAVAYEVLRIVHIQSMLTDSDVKQRGFPYSYGFRSGS